MQLKVVTIETKSAPGTVNWFSGVGEPFLSNGEPISPEIHLVHSWKEALMYSESTSWGDLRIEAANQIRQNLISINPRLIEGWNGTTAKIRPIAFDIFQTKIAPISLPVISSRHFEKIIKWDLIHILCEAEYSDIMKPAFYAHLVFGIALVDFHADTLGVIHVEN